MNRDHLFSRSILTVIVAVFLLPVLTGCADLYVTAYYDDQTWVVKNSVLNIYCEGEMFGTTIDVTHLSSDSGHVWMDLSFSNYVNTLEIAFDCQIADLVDGCCGEVQIVTMVPMMYPVSLGCGHYNQCVDF